MCVYFDPCSTNGRAHVRNQFLTVRRPKRANADGLFACLNAAMQYVGVSESKRKLIGFGCDGACVNMCAGGLRGLLQQTVPWIVVFWCFALG